jgi:pilin isopeptide linkage protein
VTEAEANKDGFTTTSLGEKGTIGSLSIAAFVNTKGVLKPSVVLRATKKLSGRTLSNGEFSFRLKDKNGKTLQTKRNTALGTVVFDEIEYDEAGTYEYTISEVKGNAANVTYDTHEAKVTVTVTDDGNGTLTAKATYDTNAPATFNNTYTPKESSSNKTTTTTTKGGTTTTTKGGTTTTTKGGTTTTTVKTTTPRTGDPTALAAVPALMAMGALGLLAGTYRRRKR